MNRSIALSLLLLACDSSSAAPSDSGADPSRDAAVSDAPASDAPGEDAARVDDPDGGGVSCPPRSGDVVGVRDPSLLVPSDRIVVRESGTVIENVDVTGDIEIVEGATDVTIRNFRITTDAYWGIYVREGSGIVIEDGEIDGLGLIDDAIRGADYTARRLYIHDIEGDAFKADGRNLIECNYITDIGQGAEAHGDGVQMMGDGDIVIRENNFELTSGSLTACIFPFGTDPVQGRVDLVGNRFNGGGWVVYCHDTVYARDNVWGPEYGYGAVTNECAEWVNNTWEADGTDVPY